MCAIDVSKALDKMNHYGLFIKLNPDSQRKTELNWNELNWTRSFSSGCTLVNRPATFGRVECCPLIYLPYTELNRMMNWTGSFSSVRLSSVQFSAVHWTGDDRRRPSQVLDSEEPATAVASRRSSSPVFVQRQTLHWLADSQVGPDGEEPATTADFIAESSQVVAGSMHSGKEFSSVQFPAVHSASVVSFNSKIPQVYSVIITLLVRLQIYYCLQLHAVLLSLA